MNTNPDPDKKPGLLTLIKTAMITVCVVGTAPAMAQANSPTDPAASFDIRQAQHRVAALEGKAETLACNPSMFCLVKLEFGERLINIGVSDSISWEVLYPDGQELVPRSYVGFKPLIGAGQANAFVFTDRRIYELNLVVDYTESMSVLSFTYPKDKAGELTADNAGASSDQ